MFHDTVNRTILIDQIQQARETLGKLLALLQSAPVERDRFVSHLYQSRPGGRTGGPAKQPGSPACRSSGASSRPFTLPGASASKAISGSGRSCCGLVTKNFYFPDGGGSFCSLLRMRSISLTIPTTRRLLSNTGRHGRSSSRIISRASSSD
jgi:hypothetical protein